MIKLKLSVVTLMLLPALGGCQKSLPQNPQTSVAAKAASNARAEFEKKIASRASPENFKEARPPVDLSKQITTNNELFKLSYCLEVQMTKWYNETKGSFTAAQLGEASSLAAKTCDSFIDGVTRANMKLVKQIADSPGTSKLTENARKALREQSYAEWRDDQVRKAELGASSYISGIQIATLPPTFRKSGSSVAPNQ